MEGDLQPHRSGTMCQKCVCICSKAHQILSFPSTLSFRITVIWILLAADFLNPVWSWKHDLQPSSKVTIQDSDVGVQRYTGPSNITEDFHIILIERDSFILGARNMVYNLSLNTLQESEKYRISWEPSTLDQNICLSKKKSLDECQNYIRVVVRKKDQSVYICGTNAFKPMCRSYKQDSDSVKLIGQELGVGKCPLDPNHNSTFTFDGGRLYSGTVVDFQGQNYLIYRDNNMMTQDKDSRFLNHPNFVKSFSYNNKVYFFFREVAVENTNCEKTVFSRVARVCKNDKGGGMLLSETFTSFFKSRLNCSMPGEFPFYFDEIQSVSDLGQGNWMSTYNSGNRTDMVYAVFNTPQNSITGSAVCAFKFSDIIRSFSGKFKGQIKPHHNWMSVPADKTPTPHPSRCTEDSTKLKPMTLNFIKSHPLMDSAVPASGGAPIFLITGVDYRFTAVTVDWQVFAADTRFYDIIFVGTDDGRVLKALNKGWQPTIEYKLIEDIVVFPDKRPIMRLHVHRKMEAGMEKLIVVSRDSVVSIPLHRCHRRDTCSGCVALQDPYCSWIGNKCANTNMGFQDIRFSGTHSLCREQETTKPSPTTTVRGRGPATCKPCVCPGHLQSTDKIVTDISKSTKKPTHVTGTPNTEPRQSESTESSGLYSVKFLAISLVLSIFISTVVGFLIGYRVSICRHPPQSHREASFLEKVDLHKTCNKFDATTDSSNQLNYSDSYQPKQLNVVLNVKGTKHPVETKPVQSNKVYL